MSVDYEKCEHCGQTVCLCGTSVNECTGCGTMVCGYCVEERYPWLENYCDDDGMLLERYCPSCATIITEFTEEEQKIIDLYNHRQAINEIIKKENKEIDMLNKQIAEKQDNIITQYINLANSYAEHRFRLSEFGKITEKLTPMYKFNKFKSDSAPELVLFDAYRKKFDLNMSGKIDTCIRCYTKQDYRKNDYYDKVETLTAPELTFLIEDTIFSGFSVKDEVKDKFLKYWTVEENYNKLIEQVIENRYGNFK